MDKQSRGEKLALWSAATIFVSAFLLFQVQPVISKKILPWFGGSPAVWTTCMLFFQLVLLAGYSYAHLLMRWVRPSRQGIIHAALLVAALATLPITPSDFWKPTDGALPSLRILFLLTCKVGAPYFLLSSTGPLIQAWFHLAYPGRSPYRLYALSNAGSLLALLSYPFWFEGAFPVNLQGAIWSAGFLLFVVLAGVWGLVMWRRGDAWNVELVGIEALSHTTPLMESTGISVARKPRSGDEVDPFWMINFDAVFPLLPFVRLFRSLRLATPPRAGDTPSFGLRLTWVLLAALGTLTLLTITNHLCQDIAPVPFLLVVPLSLYLIAFIISFEWESLYSRKLFGFLGIAGIIALTMALQAQPIDAFLTWMQTDVINGMLTRLHLATWAIENPIGIIKPFDYLAAKVGSGLRLADFGEHIIASSAAYLSVLFIICMLCDGELVKTKPKPNYLTGFYLMISLGGAIGGMFAAIVAPYIFPLTFELPLSLLCGFLLAWLALFNDGRESWLKNRPLIQLSLAVALVCSIILLARGLIDRPGNNVLALRRNFYGTLAVKTYGDETAPLSLGRGLYHGRILHGFQYSDPTRADEPTTYYNNASGAGIAVERFPREELVGMRVAVIGLGAGTMAAHAQKGDVYKFYEIDPKVIKLSDEFFTFRKDSKADSVNVVLGDARISLEREENQNYDVIVLDAFSGDAIPVHLLTDEAFKLYERHLRKDDKGQPTGVVAVHVSNRYLDLEPVVAALSRKHGYSAILVHAPEGDDSGDTASDWVLVTRNRAFLEDEDLQEAGLPLDIAVDKQVLWTDQKSSLFEILNGKDEWQNVKQRIMSWFKRGEAAPEQP